MLPGWIIGTAGAFRYALPANAGAAKFAKTRVCGYLLASMSAAPADKADTIHFEIREVTEAAVPAEVAQRFGQALIQRCAGKYSDYRTLKMASSLKSRGSNTASSG